ncbi:hypothetical protein SpCBS45565_g08210 [Spizellomyces sp. 'palustris']|nr:hypothetical protein SpCBS45565_g08210 [Spizellomyces sp. 'palustris']
MPHSTSIGTPSSSSQDAVLSEAIATIRAVPNTPDMQSLATAVSTVAIALEGVSGNNARELIARYDLSPEPFIALLPLSHMDDSLQRNIAKIIQRLLQPLPYQDIQSRFGQLIGAGLDDPRGPVRLLALSALEKATDADDTINMLIQSPFFVPVLESLAFPDVDVALRVEKLLFKVAHSAAGLQAILGDDALSILDQLLAESETVKFRVYDLAMRICTVSDEVLHQFQSSDLLKSMTEELHSDDVLSRLNAVQIFTKLSESECGNRFLLNANVLVQLAGILETDAGDVDDILVKSAIIKFFGHVAATKPADFVAMHSSLGILDLFDRQLNSDRKELAEAVILAIGNIGSSAEGLVALDEQKTLLNNFIDQINSTTGELKIAGLQSASCLIGVKSSSGADLSAITHRIFLGIAGEANPLQNLMRYAKAAFEENRVAAYAIFKGLAVHDWGLREINYSYDFVSFLMDRQIESSATGKEWKYSVVQAICSNPNANEILDENITGRFQRYVREGPFYKGVEPVVALESG